MEDIGLKPNKHDDKEVLDHLQPEGAYIFKPQWEDPLPEQYAKARMDVVHQAGQLLQQWTIMYEDGEEKAIIKVRFAPQVVKELIEFDVELNPIPDKDNKSKDITVNWSF